MSVNPIFLLTVTVEDNGPGNLSDDATVVIVLTGPTAVNQPFLEENFSCEVYPNPVDEILNLKLVSMNSDATLCFINNQGVSIYQETYPSGSSQINDMIDVSAWSKGLYIINIVTNNQHIQKKMIKK
jgi:hypothetical protein